MHARSRSALPLLLAACLLASLLACGDKAADDAALDAAPSTVDGGTDDAALDAAPIESECEDPTDCPCFTNYDCPETHACTSLDDTGESVFCTAGDRGTGVAGDPCVDEASCKSGLCLENDDGSFCTDVCELPVDCPSELPRCLFISFADVSICAP